VNGGDGRKLQEKVEERERGGGREEGRGGEGEKRRGTVVGDHLTVGGPVVNAFHECHVSHEARAHLK